jgi:hypothetical protein
MNSGIEKVIEQDDYYDVIGYSGSVYKCYKNRVGLSSYTNRVYNNLKKELEDNNMGTMGIVSIC